MKIRHITLAVVEESFLGAMKIDKPSIPPHKTLSESQPQLVELACQLF